MSDPNEETPIGWTLEPARPPRPEPPPRPPGLIERGLTAMVGATVTVAAVPFRLARPLVMSRVLAPAREAANHAVAIVVDATASIVAERLQHNPEAADLIAAYTDRLLKALSNDPLTAALVRAQAEQFVAHVEQNPAAVGPMVDAVAQRTMAMLAHNPAVLHGLARVVANDYVAYLGRNPNLLAGAADAYIQQLEQQPEKLDALVQNVAVRFMQSVERDPAPIESVVQLVGDRYVDHLNENPDTVQELLAGQSADIATEFVDQVRERNVGFDLRIEQAVRSILRMKPRGDKQVAAQPFPPPGRGEEAP